MSLAFCASVFFAAVNSQAADKTTVFVSIIPQLYFVQQIGKELVNVEVMVQPGASPATYEPKAKQMVALSGAKIYFSIGVPFENVWLKRIAGANSQMRIVHTDEGIHKLSMAAHHHEHEVEHDEEHHESAHEEDDHHKDHHDEAGVDPHIWLSPLLLKFRPVQFSKHCRKQHRNTVTFSKKITILL